MKTEMSFIGHITEVVNVVDVTINHLPVLVRVIVKNRQLNHLVRML